MRLLLQLLNRIYVTPFCNDKLLGRTRNVGGILFATMRYDIVTRQTCANVSTTNATQRKNAFTKADVGVESTGNVIRILHV